MKKILLSLAAGGLIFATGFNNSAAQEEENDGAKVPVDFYTCKYNDGMGATDLDAAIAKWNKWADGQGWNDYSAWTLTPFYSGPDQDFDFMWMGVSPTGQALGAALDDWLAKGGKIAAELDRVAPCDSHSMYYALQFKEPPKREDPTSTVISFKACNIKDGMSFGNHVAPSLSDWAEVRDSEGSTAGIWAFFPLLSGGGEEFRFYFVASYGNNEERGIDFDNHNDQKSIEILDRVLDCALTNQVYIATNRRMGDTADE
jgi:hypothetical protein